MRLIFAGIKMSINIFQSGLQSHLQLSATDYDVSLVSYSSRLEMCEHLIAKPHNGDSTYQLNGLYYTPVYIYIYTVAPQGSTHGPKGLQPPTGQRWWWSNG